MALRMLRNTWEGARVLRGRGPALDGALARPERPRRCTLPMTALRVIPPSSAAIWLADRPSAHSFLSISTRSSVHDMVPSIDEASVHGRTRAGQARQNPIPTPGGLSVRLSVRTTVGTQETVRRTRCRIDRHQTYNIR